MPCCGLTQLCQHLAGVALTPLSLNEMLHCLNDNSDKIAKRCGQALSDVGLK